jgi:pentatricopeptide repeat protein
MIHGLCKQGFLDEAEALLYKMVDNDCLPNYITFDTIVRALLVK